MNIKSLPILNGYIDPDGFKYSVKRADLTSGRNRKKWLLQTVH